jgi:cation:H+ antiporter
VKASKKWDIDASLSNAVWSNIFDICIWLWIPIIIWVWIMWLNPEINFYEHLPIFTFLIISVFVYLIVLSQKKITKRSGFYLLLLYIIFIIYLIYISI